MLDLAAALGALLDHLVGELLDFLEAVSALLAFVFVKWHEYETVVRNNSVRVDSRGGRRVTSIWPSSPEVAADRRAPRAGLVFDVPIEPGLPAIDPIGGFVVIDSGPRTHEAEKDVTRWSDNDSHMPTPNDQVTGLRARNPLKALDSDVQIVGAGVGIRKASAFVNRMDQVGTVVPGISTDFRVERGRDHAQAVVGSECSICTLLPVVRIRGLLRVV